MVIRSFKKNAREEKKESDELFFFSITLFILEREIQMSPGTLTVYIPSTFVQHVSRRTP